jgi:hypothetical protein
MDTLTINDDTNPVGHYYYARGYTETIHKVHTFPKVNLSTLRVERISTV